MKGDIKTKRARRPMWVRWEATEELGDRAWYVAYGFTRRGAIRALKRRA